MDFAFGLIDEAFALQHHLTAREIAVDVGLTCAVHRLLRQSSHAKQPLPQIVKPELKARTHSQTFLEFPLHIPPFTGG
jgi:hypothetical protein